MTSPVPTLSTVPTGPTGPTGPAVPVQESVATEVARLRAEVDATDREIARLILQRRDLSRQIQATRVAAGEARVQHAREAQVLRTWQDVLGPDGVPMALQVLELCRGRLI